MQCDLIWFPNSLIFQQMNGYIRLQSFRSFNIHFVCQNDREWSCEYVFLTLSMDIACIYFLATYDIPFSRENDLIRCGTPVENAP